MDKKRILIDFGSLGHRCGLGQICESMAPLLAGLQLPWARFTFMVPQAYVGAFGDGVDYFVNSSRFVRFPFLLPKFDLWHGTSQFSRLPRHCFHACRNVLTVHDLNFLYDTAEPERSRQLAKLQKRKINRADCITVISDFTRREVMRHLDVGTKPVRLIPDAVEDITGHEQVRPDFIQSANRPFFFFIGQIRDKKNVHVLVPMMKHFPEYDLYLCGENHFPYAETVRELIRETGVKNVFLPGTVSVEEKVYLYRHCAAFLFPSLLEGFGLPVLEAMQFGKPVFASSCSSLPEVCGGHAVLWQDFDAERMATSLREGLSVFSGRQAEAEKAYAAGFGYDIYVKRYVDLYHEVLFPQLNV
ncbi:MAG: glycosyltransferase family 4 protein [Paraprevotella sp.]|nr:glycosyltransferase family 4 protein [Paraprevotella sp.]